MVKVRVKSINHNQMVFSQIQMKILALIVKEIIRLPLKLMSKKHRPGLAIRRDNGLTRTKR